MKVAAFDIGDRWTGVALSDPLGFLARPYETVHTSQLYDFVSSLTIKEQVTTIVVGLPLTMKATESEQTKKVKEIAQSLQEKYPHIEWVLWDERLTSKQAARIKTAKTKEEKLRSHAIAAALILSSYLEYKQTQKNNSET